MVLVNIMYFFAVAYTLQGHYLWSKGLYLKIYKKQKKTLRRTSAMNGRSSTVTENRAMPRIIGITSYETLPNLTKM